MSGLNARVRRLEQRSEVLRVCPKPGWVVVVRDVPDDPQAETPQVGCGCPLQHTWLRVVVERPEDSAEVPP